MSVSQNPDPRQIIGPPFLHLVNPDGTDVACTERWEGPSGEIDPTDPQNWGPEWDNFFWSVDEQEAAALEAIEAERLADLCDALDAAWHRMMAESIPPVAGGSPEPFEPSPEDWDDYRRAFDAIDEPGPPRDQVSETELAMLAAGLAIG
jgi:hypothetical protein